MQTLDFELDRDFVELNQLLKLAGLCDSGGAGKQLVASGAVRVDGRPEDRKTAKIRAGQVVRVGDVEVANVEAVVMPAALPHVLLGNSFLTRFQMKRDNDTLRLTRR